MSSKSVHTFILFYCLTSQIYTTNCQQDVSKRAPTKESLTGIFAQVQEINKAGKAIGDVCGAVWIDEAYLITAASCLEKGILEVDDLLSISYKVNVIPMLEGKEVRRNKLGNHFHYKASSKEFRAGKAIVHPLFKRNRGYNPRYLPLAYDVALVKVDNMRDHNKVDLCEEKTVNKDANGKDLSTWTALALHDMEVWQNLENYEKPTPIVLAIVQEWQQLKQFSEPTAKKVFGVFDGRMVFIDLDKQFTIYYKYNASKIQKLNDTHAVPILTSEKASVRCIAGLMSYSGIKDGHHYITSTKVYTEDIKNWIEHAKVIISQTWGKKIPKYQYQACTGNFTRRNLNKEAQKDNHSKVKIEGQKSLQLQVVPGTWPHKEYTP